MPISACKPYRRGDPLEAIDHPVPWESFRAEIEAVVLTPDELKKSSAGRKPFDAILMFRMLVLNPRATVARWPLGSEISCSGCNGAGCVL